MTEDNKQDTSFPSGGSRTEYIGAKVTVEQKQYIRRLAAEELGVKTSPYRFASTKEEFLKAVEEVGIPCVVKPVMSSSGHGQST